jgi:hypothetical protein
MFLCFGFLFFFFFFFFFLFFFRPFCFLETKGNYSLERVGLMHAFHFHTVYIIWEM